MFSCTPVIKTIDTGRTAINFHNNFSNLAEIEEEENSESDEDLDDTITSKFTASKTDSRKNIEVTLPKVQVDTNNIEWNETTTGLMSPSSPTKGVRVGGLKTFVFCSFEIESDKEPYMAYVASVVREAEDLLANEMHDKAAKQFYTVISSVLKYWSQAKNVPELVSEMPHYYNQCIECLVDAEKLDIAINVCKEYLREYPTLLAPYQALSWCHRTVENYDEAIKTCNIGLKIFPNESSLYSLRGKATYDKGQYKLALKDFSRSLELSRIGCGETPEKGKPFKIWLRDTVF